MTSELDLSDDNLVQRLFDSGELDRIRQNQPWMRALRERTRRSMIASNLDEIDFFMRTWDQNVPVIAKNELKQILLLVAKERRIPVIRRLFHVTTPITDQSAMNGFGTILNASRHLYRHNGEKVGIIVRRYDGIAIMVGYIDASSQESVYLVEASVVVIIGNPISVTPMGLRFFTESRIEIEHNINILHTYYTMVASYVINENELIPIT